VDWEGIELSGGMIARLIRIHIISTIISGRITWRMLNAEIVKKEEDKNTETVSVRIFKLSCNIYADADNIAVWRTN
jgi:hypothetical protein